MVDLYTGSNSQLAPVGLLGKDIFDRTEAFFSVNAIIVDQVICQQLIPSQLSFFAGEDKGI